MGLDVNTKKLKKNAFRVSKVRGIGASRIRVPGGYLNAKVLGMVQEIAEEYGIAAVPTIHFYKDGKLVDSHVGVMQPQAVKDVIAQYMYA